jgi:hypothetical protein
MATTSMDMDVSPERVFETLLDARAYERWLVGCKRIRAVDRDWPQEGSRFHHEVGMWPLTIKDSTKLTERHGNTAILLEARARPAGVASVRISVRGNGTGSVVTMEETVSSGPAKLIPKPVADVMVHGRNKESLRRLKNLLET